MTNQSKLSSEEKTIYTAPQSISSPPSASAEFTEHTPNSSDVPPESAADPLEDIAESADTTQSIEATPPSPNTSPVSTDNKNNQPIEPSVVGWEDLDTNLKELFISKTESAEPLTSNNFQCTVETLNERWLPVFDVEDVFFAQSIATLESKQNESTQSLYDSASRYNGKRVIPAFDGKMLTLQLQQLAAEMPNFEPVIDYLLAEFGFVLTGEPKYFHFEPLLLAGSPGLGKTRFVSRLAAILGVHYEKISAGTLQSSCDLSGTSRTWSNTRPGRIARLLAESNEACPIVLLDEIDKLSHSTQFPVMPVLLELLEPDTAKTFRDECLEIRFDASRLIYVATANELEQIDAPILSRFRVIDIKSPDSDQRRVIIKNVFKDIVGGRDFEIEPEVIDKVAEIDIDLRDLRRQLRESVGRALLQDERCLRAHHLKLRSNPRRQRVGFY